MDIVRAFHEASLGEALNVNIQGTPEHPLFQANQVGKVLGLANIRDSIRDFDSSEKVVARTDTPGGPQDVVFLKERGLNRLLYSSKKPIAVSFRNWVADVLVELRTKGRYEMEAEYQEKLKEATVLAAAEAEDNARHTTLVEAYAKTNVVYVGKIMTNADGTMLLKIGESDDLATRSKSLIRDFGTFRLIQVWPCPRAHRCEQHFLHLPVFTERRYKEPINGRKCMEAFTVDKVHWLSELKPLIDKIVSNYQDISPWEQRRIVLEEKRVVIEEHKCKLLESMAVKYEQPVFAKLVDLVLNEPDTTTASIEIPPPVINIDDVRTHRPGDKLVLQYSYSEEDDTCTLVATYPGLHEAARAVDGAVAHCIAQACRSNTLYCDHRWMMVPRGTTTLPSLPPTESPRHRQGVVAQLSSDGSRIVALHANQVLAARAVGLRCSGSITLAIKYNRTAAQHLWAWYDELPQEVRDAFGSNDVQQVARPRGKPVRQLRADTLELVATFQNLSVACRAVQGSHRKLNEACVTGLVYKGYRWDAATDTYCLVTSSFEHFFV